jgi:hypothetical protein
VQAVLLNPCAAALDQDDKHNDKQHAGNNPNNCGTVHVNSPLFKKPVENVLGLLPDAGALAPPRQSPRPRKLKLASGAYETFGRRVPYRTALLHSRATALNKNDQHDDKQDSGSNSNQSGTVH